MSKSKGNVINPSEVIDAGYGADALRLAIAFIAPYDQTTPWNSEGVAGTHRFLARIWTLTQEYLEYSNKNKTENNEILKHTHKVIKKVSEDLHNMNFNTAIAGLMEFTNELYKIKAKDEYKAKEWKFALNTLTQLLAPFAPHIAEEIWQTLGNDQFVHTNDWPVHNEKYLVQDKATIVVQVNGKVRGKLIVTADTSQQQLEDLAKQDLKISLYLKGNIVKVINVPNKLLNFVVK
jgi:leucyl-tRNA synthetase